MKLTNEEIAKVFAMYLGCEINDTYNNKVGRLVGLNTSIHTVKIKHNTVWDLDYHEAQLHLTPLPKISDEHAIEVAKILGINTTDTLIRRKTNPFNEPFVQLYYLIEKSERIQLNLGSGKHPFHANNNRFLEEYYAIEYLKLTGHAVPLFFAPNHPCNGLTAIELEIAIDKTLLTLPV